MPRSILAFSIPSQKDFFHTRGFVFFLPSRQIFHSPRGFAPGSSNHNNNLTTATINKIGWKPHFFILVDDGNEIIVHTKFLPTGHTFFWWRFQPRVDTFFCDRRIQHHRSSHNRFAPKLSCFTFFWHCPTVKMESVRLYFFSFFPAAHHFFFFLFFVITPTHNHLTKLK
jgi:hypothetical protein